MSTAKQLRLVTDSPPAHTAHTHAATTDPVRQVFEHWVFMFGLQPARTKMDAHRRQAIGAALALYDGDVQTVMLAVEGMAAVPLGDKPQSMQEAMRELTWFLARADRIERCLRYADQVRDMLTHEAARTEAPQAEQAPTDPAAAAAARERIRQLAQQCRGLHG